VLQHTAGLKPRGDRCPVRRGFTIVELLVVVAIIVVLSGMLIAGIGAFDRAQKRQRTVIILETVRQAVELTRAQQGSAASPVEHPLAASFNDAGTPRAAFVRAGGGALPTGGLVALTGVAPGNLGSSADRLLLADDRCADAKVPLLYGLRRDAATVLGAAQRHITRYRRLKQQATETVRIADPDDRVAFPDEKHLVASLDGPEANKVALDYLLAVGNASTELSRLNALSTPPDDLPEHFVASARAWSKGTPIASRFRPGHLRDGGTWKPYRLRGLAIYDAWGVEVLCSILSDGVVRLVSAGPDGAMRWLPGNGTDYATAPEADAPSGNDSDASRDNVALVVGAK